MGFADMPLVNIQTGEEIPVLKKKTPQIKSEAGSTAGAIFGLTVVGFILVLAVMSLIKIGLVWFG